MIINSVNRGFMLRNKLSTNVKQHGDIRVYIVSYPSTGQFWFGKEAKVYIEEGVTIFDRMYFYNFEKNKTI